MNKRIDIKIFWLKKLEKYKYLITALFLHVLLLFISGPILIVAPSNKDEVIIDIRQKPHREEVVKAAEIHDKKVIEEVPLHIIEKTIQMKKMIVIEKGRKLSTFIQLPSGLSPKKIKFNPSIRYKLIPMESLLKPRADIQGKEIISFFGSEGGEDVSSVVFVVDRSGSMYGRRIAKVKKELKKSISGLNPTHRFTLIFYAHYTQEFNPKTRLLKYFPSRWGLVTASESNKKKCLEFIDTIEPDGGTDPLPAMKSALSYKPDLIYLLTDGLFRKPIYEELTFYNKDKITKINTIAFEYKPGENVLRKIAEQNRGEFKYVK